VTGEVFAGEPVGPPPDVLVLEVTATEAAFGTTRPLFVPALGGVVPVQVPFGTVNNTMLRVPLAPPVPGGPPPGEIVVVVRVIAFDRPAPVAPRPRGRFARRRPLLAAAAIARLLVVACGAAVALRLSGSGGGGTLGTRRAAAGQSASASPRPSPISPAAYDQALAAADTALIPAFQQVVAAATVQALHTAAKAAATVVDTETDKLAAIVPPAAADAAHRMLVNGLTRVEDDLNSMGSGYGSACTGAGAAAYFNDSTPITLVRSAAQALGTADPAHPYTFGKFIPPAGAKAERRLNNGAFVKRGGRRGSGELKIENGGSVDTAITIAPANTKQAMVIVYVRAGSNFTAKGIPDGTYQVYMASGRDWDAATRGFTRDCEFEKFADTFDYRTTRTTYTVWTITLTPVAGGNARTDPVDPGAYPTG
jgi:hypothetical protein